MQTGNGKPICNYCGSVQDFCRCCNPSFEDTVGETLFIEQVMQQIKCTDSKDTGKVRASVPELYNSGFTVSDAVAYLRCFQEVSPELDENRALDTMSVLRNKYLKR